MTADRCNCATFGDAHTCPIHTQADYAASMVVVDPAEQLAKIRSDHDDCSDDWCAYHHSHGQADCPVPWLLARIAELETENEIAGRD